MSIILTTAGSKLYIGPAKQSNGTDFVASDFSSITGGSWVEVKGVTNLGQGGGDTADLITSNQIGIRRTRKGKGVRNAGSMTLVADFDSADAGQLAVIAAEKVDDTYAFKLVLDDAPTGGTGSTRFWTALVMSASETYDQANNVVLLNSTLEVDSNFVRVAPTSP